MHTGERGWGGIFLQNLGKSGKCSDPIAGITAERFFWRGVNEKRGPCAVISAVFFVCAGLRKNLELDVLGSKLV